jgi:hypothetical protein
MWHWGHVVNSSYLAGVGIYWSNVRNVMDKLAVYGGYDTTTRLETILIPPVYFKKPFKRL